jgi:hypothetical protein
MTTTQEQEDREYAALHGIDGSNYDALQRAAADIYASYGFIVSDFVPTRWLVDMMASIGANITQRGPKPKERGGE